MLEMPSTRQTSLLVIGYGNTLRGDDGVGPLVAEAVEALCLPGVNSFACPQLSPEHADVIACARTVIFVDGAMDKSSQICLRILKPAQKSQIMAHAADPRTMLALARDVYGHIPKAWMLTIPMVNSGFSETLSSTAQCGLEQAISEIQRIYRHEISICALP